MGENLSLGLSTALIGMLVVFIGLLILILCIVLMNKVNVHKKKKKDDRPAAQPKPEAPGRPAPDQPSGFEGIDPGVIAAISAAVACMLEKESDNGEPEADGFVVRRIVRLQNAPAWQRSGREEQIYSHI